MKRLLSIMFICLFLYVNMQGETAYSSGFQLPKSELLTTSEDKGESWRIRFNQDETASISFGPERYSFTGDAQCTTGEQLGIVSSIFINHFHVSFMRNDNVEIKEVSLLYKVYEVGMNVGWNKIDATSHIEEMHYNKETQCFESHMSYDLYPPVTYNVTEGLTPGKSCVLEVMFQVVDSEDNTFTLLEDQECGRFYFTLKGDPAIEPTDYHPFVEQGKRWCVHGFSMGGQHTVTDYSFSDALEYISHDGHEYSKFLAWRDNQLTEVGEVREEDRRVYFYDTDAGQEYLIYDFSLEVGDTFKETRQNLIFTVDSTGQIVVNGDTLKTLHLSALDGVVTINWVEGVGNTNSPLENFYADTPVSWSYRVAYVSGSSYWPFSFSIPYNGWWGQNLTRGMENQDYASTHSYGENDLQYELVPDPEHDAYALHVSGIMWLYCGGNLYAYCRTERTEDITAYKLYLQLDTPTDYTDCTSPYHVELYFPFFLAEHKYIAVDERGEHPVAVRDAAYRPFIEEGKVWKVGWFPGGMNTAQKLDYYYFDGDSITIGGKVCLKMRCRHEANEQWGNPEPWSEYVGAFYEDGRKVFCVFPDKQDFELLYDFESNIGDTIQVYGGVGADQYPTVSCIISKREYINDELFKGGVTYVDVEEPEWDNETQTFINKYNHDDPNRWMEGVGSRTPFANIMFSEWSGFYDGLMSCTVGDEILYYNPYLIDGVTPPDGAEVKRQWLDFTHIKKPRPRAPGKERYGMTADEGSDAETLTGEYSIKDLFVNFKPLSGAYTITVTDANDEEVYHKEVQTDNVIALNTALSTYAHGTYTLTVENAEEAYTATFILDDETAVRDIPSDSTVNHKSVNSKYYDLSGPQTPQSSFLKGQASKLERLTRHLPKGIYIRDGKKVVVK